MGKREYIHLGIMLIIMAVFWVLQPIEPLTEVGMKVLGVFLAGCWGWSTCGVLWPSILCICALPLTGVATINELLAAGTGNFMFLFIMFILVFNQLLDDSGVNVAIANFFISRKIVKGRPYVLIFFLLFAGYLIGTVCNLFLTMFLMWGIIYGIANSCGYEKKDKLPSILIVAMLFVLLMGYMAMPFHGMTVQLLAAWANMAQVEIPFASWLAFSLPMGLGSIVLCCLVIRFVIRPDVSKLVAYDPDSVDKETIRFTKGKTIVLAMLIFFVLTLLIGNSLPTTNPVGYLVKTLGNSGMISLVILALMFIRVDGKPLFNFKETAAKGLSFDVLICTAYMLMLSSYMSGQATGINVFFMKLLTPFLGGLSPVMFCLVCGIVVAVLTNFLANIAVAYMFLPIALSFAPVIGFNPTIMAMIIIYAAHLSIATPAASIYSALMFANTEWLETKTAVRYALTIVVFAIIIMVPCATMLAFAIN